MSYGVEIINSSTYTAKKEYEDDGWDFMHEWIAGGCWIHGKYNNQVNRITFAEARQIVRYRKDRKAGGIISPGEKYVRQFNKYEGQTYTWRTKELFYKLACKYELFPEL